MLMYLYNFRYSTLPKNSMFFYILSTPTTLNLFYKTTRLKSIKILCFNGTHRPFTNTNCQCLLRHR